MVSTRRETRVVDRLRRSASIPGRVKVRDNFQFGSLRKGSIVGLTGLMSQQIGAIYEGSSSPRFRGDSYADFFLARVAEDQISEVRIQVSELGYDARGNIKVREYSVRQYFEGDPGYANKDRRLTRNGI